MTTFTLLSCVVGLISASKCPDITAFRSDRVQKSFDPKLLDGFWFEHAFIDIAQEGASCQTLNSTFNPTTDKISMAFKVDYAFVPFTIIENYAPKGNVTGYYTKKAQMPGSALLTLPTVVVDVIPSSSGDKYDAMTLYSCIDPLNAVQVTELIFATRSPTIDAGALAQMEAYARAAGVSWKNESLKKVDHSKCKNPSPPNATF